MPAINIVCGHRRVDALTNAAFVGIDGTIDQIISGAVPSRMSDGLILPVNRRAKLPRIGVHYPGAATSRKTFVTIQRESA